MPWLDQTAAVLEAWYPGAGGADAIADVIFGVVNPSGRLPITFPASTDQIASPQLPGFGLPPGQSFDAPHPRGSEVGYRWTTTHDQTPLFPFGFGLSYTHFTYSGLEVRGGKYLTVSFDARNDGSRGGKDTPQAYLTSMAGQKETRLVGFGKIELAPGEQKHVVLQVDPRLLARFDAAKQRWHVKAGTYQIGVGAASTDLKLTGSAKMSEIWRAP